MCANVLIHAQPSCADLYPLHLTFQIKSHQEDLRSAYQVLALYIS